MNILFLLSINDGLGRSTEIGLFTSEEKLKEYQEQNPKGLYESWEIKELKIIA